jgi:hypothetical protein
MSEKETGGPAFPFPAYTYPNGEINHGESGMTLRQYAAIKLKVPDSGTDWLDAMIEKSVLNDIAAKAMQGWISSAPAMGDDVLNGGDEHASIIAGCAYTYANALLKASKK